MINKFRKNSKKFTCAHATANIQSYIGRMQVCITLKRLNLKS